MIRSPEKAKPDGLIPAAKYYSDMPRTLEPVKLATIDLVFLHGVHATQH